MKERLKCKRVLKRLNAFSDKELENYEAKQIAEHLISCESCRKELESLQSINRLLDKVQEIELSPSLQKRLALIPQTKPKRNSRFRTPVRVAPLPAAAAVLLTLFSAILLGRSFITIQESSETTYDSYSIAQESFYTIWEEISHE